MPEQISVEGYLSVHELTASTVGFYIMPAYIDQNTDIGGLVRKMETDFISGSTTMSKYVQFSLWEDISRIYAYLDSKHISGGDDKPFFNIVLAARNIWYRSTDIDRSNIKIRSTKSSDDMGAFLATVHLQDWMRRENFGQFLNAWGLNSAAFNESVLKFVEQDGRLIPSVIPWSRIICDQIDFAANPKIEVLELTEAQLRQRKGYNKDIVTKLCDTLAARELTDRQTKDIKNNYIKLYEIHGELPLSYLTGNPDDSEEYTQQMHVITFVAGKEKGDWDDFTLYSGKEAKDPYILTALLPEIDGSIALRGSVKTLFDAQWMQNHSVLAIKNQLDLASKLIFQTSDATFIGQNALSAIQNGDILIHKPNEPLTQLQNNSHDTTSIQNFQSMWKSLGNEITGISESMLGQSAPSGTAWRQVEALLQENRSLFDLMTENRGISIEYMLREFIIPYIRKHMNSSKEVATTLSSYDISKVDARYIKNFAIQKSNKEVINKTLEGELVTPEQQQEMIQGYAQEAQSALREQGNQRFFAPSEIPDKTWKDAFKDLEWDVECDITNENLDKNASETLNKLLQFFQAKGGAPMTPEEKFVVEKILRLTGTVSTVELASMPQSPPPQAQPDKVSKSISFKDLPPDGQQQLAAQAGLQIQPAPVEAGNQPINQ